MSRFNSYARELDTVAREFFAEHSVAAAEYESAEAVYKQNKRPDGAWYNPSAEAVVKAANSEIAYLQAKERLERTKSVVLPDVKARIGKLRDELKVAAEEFYLAKPGDVDANLISILDSDILTPSEYVRLFEQAVQNDNATMARLIGAAAGKVAEKMDKNDLSTEERNSRGTLLIVSQNAKKYGATGHLEDFDGLVDMFNVCARNPASGKLWDMHAAKHIENF